VKPVPSHPNDCGEQKSYEKDLSTTPIPKKKPQHRTDNHQAGIDDRYPGNGLFANDGSMIIPDLNKENAKSPKQNEDNRFVEAPKFRRFQAGKLPAMSFSR
jgi:hypothetical protein